MFLVKVSKVTRGRCSVTTHRTPFWALEASTLWVLGNLRFSILIFAKLGYPTALVLVIQLRKFIFIEHTQIYPNIDLVFNIDYRPKTKNDCPVILSYPSKIRKSIKISTEDLFLLLWNHQKIIWSTMIVMKQTLGNIKFYIKATTLECATSCNTCNSVPTSIYRSE